MNMGQAKARVSFWDNQVSNPLVFFLAGLIMIGAAVLAIDRFERRSLEHYDHIQDTTSGVLPTPQDTGQTAGASTSRLNPDSSASPSNQSSTRSTQTVTRNSTVTTTNTSSTSQGGQSTTTPASPPPAPSTPPPTPTPQPQPTPAPTPPPPSNGGGILEPVCGLLPILC